MKWAAPIQATSMAPSEGECRPVTLTYSHLEHTINIPTFFHATMTRLRDVFIRTLNQSADGNGPSSSIELVARFLGFIAQEIERGRDADTSLDREILMFALEQFESAFLRQNELHAILATLPNDANRPVIIHSYYTALKTIRRPCRIQKSALMSAAMEGKARVYVVFGGQGNMETYLDELRTIYTSYSPFIKRFVTTAVQHLQQLVRNAEASKTFLLHGLDVMNWLDNADLQPNPEYLVSAPVSFPLIGLTQLVHYAITSHVLGTHPGDIRDHILGASGHSQGIVTAAAIAASKDWDSFETQARNALTVLFWIGIRSQEAYPLPSISPSVLEDSREHGEGTPGPALSVRGLPRVALDTVIESINRHLHEDRHIAISLVNSATNLVVTGPPLVLHSLNLQLRRLRTMNDTNRSDPLFSPRKTSFITQFLPISAPFHSPYLSEATARICQDLRETRISAKELGIPVYNTFTGLDIRNEMNDEDDIVPCLVKMICQQPVLWKKAIAMADATHILDFGPGGISGIGGLTNRIKDGTGVRVVLAGTMTGTKAEVGYKDEVFARNAQDVKYNTSWAQQFGPKLGRTSDGQVVVVTRMSTLLGLPPIMVAGMTPTTVPWDFVASTMSAGYEIELAGGGYYDNKGLTEAIMKVMDNIPSGRGIVLNMIYASPKMIAWQIPLLRNLCAQGVPIKGVTIGAGVPSLEIANEYIRTLGIRQIGFKPASKESIRQVIDIAEANPGFPVFLQWTGGRGGGHHSNEDFHEPILSSYSRIRRCANIVLVAGSGFGSADDTYPYLTGTWSERYDHPPMPFDGVLFGSRCMVAKEAHTSMSVKQTIVDTKGLGDHEWEKTYHKQGGGGVITVRSEMGEPIHKIATRGVLLWAEMDKQIFSLPKEKRLHELQKKEVHDYIVQRLNDDFQKPWFGRTASERLVDIQEMTYGEVIYRMVDLMFIKHQQRWIDESLARLTGDFIRHVEQRFLQHDDNGRSSFIQDYNELDDPFLTVKKMLSACPQAGKQLMNAQDCQHFLQLCKRTGQKPVPFVPALDDDFELWFKKDSLWQSENIDAVVGKDVGRVCILQGPVAAKHSTTTDESIKGILDGIYNGYVEKLTEDYFGGDESKIPVLEVFGNKEPLDVHTECEEVPEGVTISKTDNLTTYLIPASSGVTVPDQGKWIQLLAGMPGTWRHAFFMADVFVQGQRFVSNPTHRILAPTKGMMVQISHSDEPWKTVIFVKEAIHRENLTTTQIGLISNNTITMSLIQHGTASGKPVALRLIFTYHPEAGYAPIREIMASRNERIREFYYTLWLGEKPTAALDMPITSRFDGSPVTINGAAIREFAHTIGNTSEAYIDRRGRDCFAPMDFAIVVSWKALIKALLHVIDGDLLRLVHLSNGFRMMPGAEPFRKGDVLSATAEITAIINQDSGKMVEVCGSVTRDDGTPVMQLTSQFLYRGVYLDYENTFQQKIEKPFKVHLETPEHVAILQAKKWFKSEKADMELVGQTVVFKLQTLATFSDVAGFASVETVGTIELELPTMMGVLRVASVEYVAGPSFGNPVLDYLNRTGSEIDHTVYLERPIPICDKSNNTLTINAPASNARYSRVSGDYNPVHTSRAFSEYVGLPGTITHGMHTSGAIRSVVENWVIENDKASMMRDFHVKFVGMVLPGDSIEVRMNHIGMASGCKVIQIEAAKTLTGEKVLVGRASVKQPVSAYIFPGQGSQEQGMGMDLYSKSPVAKKVWDRADRHLRDTYGKRRDA